MVLAGLLTPCFSLLPWSGECWLWLTSDTEEVLLKGPRDAPSSKRFCSSDICLVLVLRTVDWCWRKSPERNFPLYP